MTIANPDTGQGATLAFGTAVFVANYLSISPKGISRASLETTNLGTTTAHAFTPEDLINNGEVTCEYFYDPKTAPPIGAVPETITITYPIPVSNSTGTTLAGSGFVTEYVQGSAMIGELMKGSLTFKWAGTVTLTAGS